MAGNRRPLWTCPKCGHRFVNRNQWHSCSRYRLSDHLQGKPRRIRELFDAFRALAESCGPVTVYAQKTRIVFQVRVRFASAVPRKRWLNCGFWLTRRARHPLIHRADKIAPRCYACHCRLTDASQLDESFAALMRRAYSIGCQEHLRSPKRST
ncbi:MAG: DUF5655 domain-containing protein [Planctomycetota bacterium]